MAFNGNAQARLLGFVAGLQCAGDLWQHLVCQLQQDLTLRRKAQGLTFTHKKPEAKALFQIAELVGKCGLRLVQRGRRRRERSAVP